MATQMVVTSQNALVNLWYTMMAFLPNMVAAFVILLIGYLIAKLIGSVARRGLELLKVDALATDVGLKQEIMELGIGNINFAALVGWFVKWFIFLAAIIAAVEVLHVEQLSIYMQKLVVYIPNVLVAILILAIGLVAGNAVRTIITGGFGNIKNTHRFAETLGKIAKWAVFVFSLMAALTQMGIADRLIEILFTGIVAMVAIAGGVAFGLGGRDHASKVLSSMEDEVRSLN